MNNKEIIEKISSRLKDLQEVKKFNFLEEQLIVNLEKEIAKRKETIEASRIVEKDIIQEIEALKQGFNLEE